MRPEARPHAPSSRDHRGLGKTGPAGSCRAGWPACRFRGRRPYRTACIGNAAQRAGHTRGRCARRRDRTDCAMTSRDPKHAFTSRPRDADTWIRAGGLSPPKNAAKAHHFTARLTIDVTPDLRGRIKVAAFRRGITVAEMLRDLLSREFPDRKSTRLNSSHT